MADTGGNKPLQFRGSCYWLSWDYRWISISISCIPLQDPKYVGKLAKVICRLLVESVNIITLLTIVRDLGVVENLGSNLHDYHHRK